MGLSCTHLADRFWANYGIAAIATTLFKAHGWDFDRAVAAAYWLKKGRLITTDYGRYVTIGLKLKALPIIPEDDAEDLLREYNQKGLGRPG